MKLFPILPTAIVVGSLLAGTSVTAAGPAAPFLVGIRPLGMGNAFLAVADDRNALHYNPAGLGNLDGTRVSGLGLHGGIDDEFLEVIEFIQDNEDQFANFDTIDQDFYDSLAPFDDRWVASDVHAYTDLTRPGFGIGVYTTGRVQFKIDRGVYEPRVHANVFDDIVAVTGGAMSLGRADLTVGGALKGIWRRETTRALTAREVADFDPADILDDLAGAEPGFGIDLGARWQRPGSSVALGAVLRDAAGFVGGERIETALDLGVAWRPLGDSWGPDRGLLVASDLRNIFESDVGLGNKIHLGAELRSPVFSLRGGFNQGYPSFGATVGLKVIEIDYAFYGRELGSFPGAESQFLHAVEARLGFF